MVFFGEGLNETVESGCPFFRGRVRRDVDWYVRFCFYTRSNFQSAFSFLLRCRARDHRLTYVRT